MEINKADQFNKLKEIYYRKNPPAEDKLFPVLSEVCEVLENEDAETRPWGDEGKNKDLPGGIVKLNPDLPLIIIPDIHARMGFIMSVLLLPLQGGAMVLDRLYEGSIQLLCLGDGFHSEGTSKRWRLAMDEFASQYKRHKNMDQEMLESLGTMEMVMHLKIAFPRLFHFLKGNHENILNEEDHGNYPFRKYAYEGAMVLEYIKKFYSKDFLYNYSRFEKNFPLLAIGNRYLISHAEPLEFFDYQSVLNYRQYPDVIRGLTWTDNDQADDDSVSKMLAHYLAQEIADEAYYFGGHRHVLDAYHLRAKGRFVQINHPKKYMIAHIHENGVFDPDNDIFEVEEIKIPVSI